VKLRPYHNPENVDESKVPAGWRFRYADEMVEPVSTPCRIFFNQTEVSVDQDYFGASMRISYIVPVTS